MNSRDIAEDAAFFLYLAPVVASIVYGAVEWYEIDRTSHSMPLLAYLIVSKSPYLFLFSIAAVCFALVIETRFADYNERPKVILGNATRMQILAVVVLIVSFAGALSNAGYTDIGTAFGVFLNGRFALIYGFFLLGTSILLSPRQLIGKAGTGMVAEILGLLLIGLSPAVLYVANKIHITLSISAGVATIVLLIGVYLLVAGSKLFQKKTTSVEPIQVKSSA